MHLSNIKELRHQNENEETSCKICDKTFRRKDLKEHQNTLAHIEAQKLRYGEIECDICGEKFAKGCRKQHKKSKIHLWKLEHLEMKNNKKRHDVAARISYAMQEASVENRSYIDTLTAFLALRLCFETNENFKISTNNAEFADFGDLVFEFDHETVAIQCKKIERAKTFNSIALRAESGHLSVFKQWQSVAKIRRENPNTSFKLLTVSRLNIDETKFVYESGTFWASKEMQVRQPNKHDIFNTGDPEDCCYFVLSSADGAVVDDLKHLKFYFNQRNILELKSALKNLIMEHLGVDFEFSDELVSFVPVNFWLIRNDFLLKLAELLLKNFCVFPDGLYKPKQIDLWISIIKEFDVILLDQSSTKKIHKILNQILIKETGFVFDSSQKAVVDLSKIQNDKLKSHLYNHGGTLQCLHLALWKSEITPLILNPKTKENLQYCHKIINFFHTQNFRLKFIILTSDDTSFPAGNLKLFRNFTSLKLYNEPIWRQVSQLNVSLLNEDVSLGVIFAQNEDLFDQWRPDFLLNILFDDFSYRDFQVPILTDFYTSGVVLDEELFERILEQKRIEEDKEDGLKYLVDVEGILSVITVPPTL